MKEKFKLLPKSWDEVTLLQFHKLLDCNVSNDNDFTDGYQNIINVASVLLEIPVEDFDDLPMKDINELVRILNFTSIEIPKKKTNKFKWKDINEITMDDYISFIQLGDKQLYNLNVFIKNFNKIEFTDEQILELSITEVMYGFFLFRRQLRKFLRALTISEKKHLAILKIKQIAKRLINQVTSEKTTMK